MHGGTYGSEVCLGGSPPAVPVTHGCWHGQGWVLGGTLGVLCHLGMGEMCCSALGCGQGHELYAVTPRRRLTARWTPSLPRCKSSPRTW